MLLSTALGPFIGLAASAVKAQASTPQVLAAVAFVTQGETAQRADDDSVYLTPRGAQQMFRQGTAFRNRYLSNGTSNGTEAAPIYGLSIDVINNMQLNLLAASTEWHASGATAFMQGLYPPKGFSFGDSGQGVAATNYPLNGYQYAEISTIGPQDSEFSAVEGTQGCQAWHDEMNRNLTRSADIVGKVSETQPFYSNLTASGPLLGQESLVDATYLYAVEVFQTVNYLFDNNQTVHDGLANANDTLTTLENNAFSLELAKTRYNNTDKTDPRNILYGIAGRTLASQVTGSFVDFMLDKEKGPKLTVIFGSWRPMMSFFSAADLFNPQNPSAPWTQLPKPGSAMVFELVGDSGSGATARGSQVRFYYRPSADSDDEFTSYPLFGSPTGSNMSHDAFSSRMNDISKNSSDWCSICKPRGQTSYCQQFTTIRVNNAVGDNCKTHLSTPVVGIIGALIMCAVLAFVVFAFAMVRRHRSNRTSGEPRLAAGGGGGGFRGADKKTGDADVVVSKTGRQEARVGSWELGNSRKEIFDGQPGAGIVTSDFAHRTRCMDDDSISISETPVQPREGF